MNKKEREIKTQNIDLKPDDFDELASFIERKKIQNDAFKKIIENLDSTQSKTKKSKN